MDKLIFDAGPLITACRFSVSNRPIIDHILKLGKLYQRYRLGEISFGRLAQELGVTTWELGYLLEERGWPAYNLPSTS